eukprot:COSAG02_NODE_4963_length_4776_cov_2.041052_3_plen_235_part_00
MATVPSVLATAVGAVAPPAVVEQHETFPQPPSLQPPSSPRLTLAHGLSQFERVHSVPAGLVHIPSPTTQRRCLYHAAKSGDIDELRSMLDAGLRPDAPDQATPVPAIATAPGRRNALHFAVIYGNLEMVRMLLDAGASVNAPDRSGWQPLHFAALNGRPTKLEITKLLLDAGGNRHAAIAVQQHNSLAMRLPPSSPGRRPLTVAAAEFARRHGQPDIAALIDDYGGVDGGDAAR